MATAAYVPAHALNNSIAAFLAAHVVKDAKWYEKANDLYSTYLTFCRGEGYRPLSQTAMGRTLTGRGFQVRRTSVAFWIGIKIASRPSIPGASAMLDAVSASIPLDKRRKRAKR